MAGDILIDGFESLLRNPITHGLLLYCGVRFIIWITTIGKPEEREEAYNETFAWMFTMFVLAAGLTILAKIPLGIPLLAAFIGYILWKIVKKAVENARR